jgi:hypothetical protein
VPRPPIEPRWRPKVYAATIAAPSAIDAYLDFCRASATAILRDHWSSTLTLAAKLDERGTLSGAEIDELIAEAETKAVHAAELSRRKKWAETLANAKMWRFSQRFLRIFSIPKQKAEQKTLQ